MRKTKTAFLGVMTALALIFSYVESLVPIPIPVPGIKLGLANLMVVVLLFTVGTKEAFWMNLARILLSGFLFGNFSSILYSIAGALVSVGVMLLLKRTGRFSIIGVSIAGGTAHNIGQILVAAAVLENLDLLFYAPILMITGEVTGFLIGITGCEIIQRLPKEKNR